MGTSVSGNGTTVAPTAPGTYTVVGSFAGSVDFTGWREEPQPVTFTITKAAPTVTVADLGGAYRGFPYTADAVVSGVVEGVDARRWAGLEGVPVTVAYYVGDTVSGSGIGDGPQRGGIYTVVARSPAARTMPRPPPPR